MTIEKAMSPNLVKVNPSDSVAEAAKVMEKHRIGCVLVEEDNNIIGIVTERDILGKVVAQEKNYDIKVKEIMSSPVKSVEVNSSLEEGNNLMLREHIRRLLITKDGKPVGIVTLRDIANQLKYYFASKIQSREI